MKIPVYSPLFIGNEKKYLMQCINKGWISSSGYFVQKFEEEFAKWSGNRYAVAVCNGTAALEVAIWSSDIKKHIAVPNSTIISCWLAPQRIGKTTTLYQNYLTQNGEIDGNLLRCHLFGYFNKLKATGITIDDSSQYWKPFRVKDIACYSLYANKLITSGEGGIIVTNNKKYCELAKSYRNLCHSNKRFIHWNMGYNFRMSNIQAAVALAQLENIDKFVEIKQKNRDLYMKYLPSPAISLFNVEIPWMYLIKVRNAKKVVEKMTNRGIECRRFFYPLGKQKFIFSDIDNSEAINFWNTLLYLPSGLTLTKEQIKYICLTLEKSQ